MPALEQRLVAVLYRPGRSLDPHFPKQQLKAPDEHFLTRHRPQLEPLPAAEIDLAVSPQDALAGGDGKLIESLPDRIPLCGAEIQERVVDIKKDLFSLSLAHFTAP